MSGIASHPSAKVFDCGSHALLFLRDRLELRLVPAAQAAGLQQALGLLEEPAQSLGDTIAGRAVLMDRLRQSADNVFQPTSSADVLPQEAKGGGVPRPSIDRLTLTVSNVCNLGCSYCYAAKGTYYNRNGLMMTPETVFAALNQAARAYSRIEHINFFGGEPTLNAEVIKIACDYTEFLFRNGRLTHLPSFGITTNGHALSESVLRLLQDYRFSVTLSLDGPREIHDAARPTKGGLGSYDSVAKTARQLIACGLEIEFECTYSQHHLKRDITIVDLMDFFHAEFGCRTLHCQVVSAAPGSPEFIPLDTSLRLQLQAIDASLDNLAKGTPNAVSIAARMLHSLSSRAPIWNYCPAGRKEVTVNADGDVYACFMLMEQPSYSYGSVLVETSNKKRVTSPPRSSQREHIDSLLQQQDKYGNAACRACWAQPLCHGCLGEDFARSDGRGVVRSAVSGESEFCDYKRSLIEGFLRAVGRTTMKTPLDRVDGSTALESS
jgi:uncharacterized protein